MTIEEKAKAYDEALEKAKIEINTKGIGETVDLCEQLFPELRESEDERIRKSLINFLTAIKIISESGRTSWAVREDDAEMCKSFIAWLKKQKECVADNSKTSTDEDERIINQLITLVNSAGEVLLIPTNKEELVAWLNKYKESLHIQETCEENANSFADGIIEVRSFQRGMEEGRRLERQKEQNGEDGFLEDELSVFLQNYDKEYDDDAAVSDVARHFYEIGKKQNEQKPHTAEEKEYVRTIKSIISDFIRDKEPENLAYYQRIYDWLDGRHVPFSCGHENGQPAEWDELQTDFRSINEAFEKERRRLKGYLKEEVCASDVCAYRGICTVKRDEYCPMFKSKEEGGNG